VGLQALVLAAVIGFRWLGKPVVSVHGRWDYVLAGAALACLAAASCLPETRLWNGWSWTVRLIQGTLGRVPLWAVTVPVLALAVRLAYLGWVGPALVEYDAATYDSLARGMLEGKGYVYRGGHALYAPGYPLFLAGVYTVAGRGVWPVLLLQSLLGAGSCLLLYLIGRRAGDLQARLASLLLALSPGHVYYTNALRFEVLSAFLALAALHLFLLSLDRPVWWRGLATGVVTGASILVRVPTMLLGAAFLALAWRRHESSWPRAALRALAPIVAGVVLAIGPWTVRNYVVLHRFVPISVDFGHNFHLGNDAAHDGDLYPGFPWLYASLGDVGASHEYTKRAWDTILRAPGASVWLIVRKAVVMVDPFGVERPGKCEHLMIAYNTVLLLMVTMAISRRETFRAPLNRAALLYGLLWVIAFALVLAQPRYRLPALPFACLLAGAALPSPGTREPTRRRLAGGE
jgi:4-amino-4-deoxy-L-arabinose transferase-like glycosyltransferase